MTDRGVLRVLIEMTPFGWWSAKRAGRGVTVLERRDDFHATVLSDNPAVHIHYFATTDEEVEKQGWALAHLVCHDCNRARAITYPNYDDADIPTDGLGIASLRAERERYSREHRHGGIYGAGGGNFLCPPHYVITDEIDLR